MKEKTVDAGKSRTIAAISTPAGSGGIAVIRISGADALRVVRAFFTADGKDAFKPRVAYLGTARLDGFSDRCVVTCFSAPRSYTGEDVVEISCHGGAFVAEAVLQKCLTSGASLAEAGEFTRLAFLNGKLSLADAEGVIDLINAESEAEANAASYLADGALSREAKEIQSKLIDLLASVNTAIDYPDEADFWNKDEVAAALSEITAQLRKLTDSYTYGKILKRGLNIVIAGRPNAGKSSLMNALVKSERSIVTPVAGTTRDAVSETLLIKDIKVNLTDTAGIRGDGDEIEKLGVEKSKKALATADAVLYVFDGTEELTEDDQEILETVRDKKVLLLANKCDLAKGKTHSGALSVSAKSGTNINKLAEEIYNFAKGKKGGGITLTNERHISVLSRVTVLLQSAQKLLKHHTADLIAEDLTEAYKKLGEITGTTAGEEIINRIFEKFCLGK